MIVRSNFNWKKAKIPTVMNTSCKSASTPRTLLNLIPYSPRRGSPWPAPTEEKVEHFLAKLIELGVYAKRRRTKGRDLMGACGQLGSEHIRQRKLVDVTVSG